MPTEMAAAKRAILEESLRQFATRGIDAVSVRDIAAATEFTNPAIFRHFPSKEALAQDLFERCYARLISVIDGLPADVHFSRWLATIFSEIQGSPEGVHFIIENLRRFWSVLPPELKARNLPLLVRLRLEHEVRAGHFRADLNLPLARTFVVGLIAQVARGAHFHDSPFEPEELAYSVHEMLFRGFGPPGVEHQ